MRLLHTTLLQFKEFFDEIPDYAILSHRWGAVDQEVSYNDFISQAKEDTTGYKKIVNFCGVASRNGLQYCWIDTCCIDKSSHSEITEAINSMYAWYERASVCYAFLRDISDVSQLSRSEWFTRGWTLQELIAPREVQFFDQQWRPIGTRFELRREISLASGIDESALGREVNLDHYSVAQIMSWAALRQTSRIEDQAYCLLGLFGVNMPLLYGEGDGAFRRLQEEILARGEDHSLFAWGASTRSSALFARLNRVLAASPRAFEGCGNITRGFSSQRILFETTSRGIMVLIHRSYDWETLHTLLESCVGRGLGVDIFSNDGALLGLSIPLGCYERGNNYTSDSFFLELVCYAGKWHRIGVIKQFEEISPARYRGNHYPAYSNDYVRIYMQHDRKGQRSWNDLERPISRPIKFLYLRDANYKG